MLMKIYLVLEGIYHRKAFHNKMCNRFILFLLGDAFNTNYHGDVEHNILHYMDR